MNNKKIIQIPFEVKDIPKDYGFVYTLNHILNSCMSVERQTSVCLAIHIQFVERKFSNTLGAAIRRFQTIRKFGEDGQTRKMRKQELEFFKEFFQLEESELINPKMAHLHYIENLASV